MKKLIRHPATRAFALVLVGAVAAYLSQLLGAPP